MRHYMLSSLIGLGVFFFLLQAHAGPKLVVTIQPLYLLAMEVAGGGAEIQRLIPPHRSPHDYRLLPSQRLQLSDADAIVWLGPQLETGLAAVLQSSVVGVPVFALGARHEAAHPAKGDSRSVEAGGHVAGVSQHGDGEDAHDWLDPRAAADIARRLGDLLGRLDPAGSAGYRQRAKRLAASLAELEQELRPLLMPMRGQRYWVAHDAYGQFEARFGLQHSAVVAVSPERLPGAAHILGLQQQLEAGEVDCIFREPQFRPPILERLLLGRAVPVIDLDPLASEEMAGPGRFVAFLRDFAIRFASCGEAE